MRDVRHWALLFLLGVVLYQSYCTERPPSDAEERLQALRTALRDASERRDDLAATLEAERAQRAAERDSLEVVVDVADTVFVTSIDTLRVIVTDTAALRIIDDLEESHEVAMAGKDSIIAGQDVVIERQDSLLWAGSQLDSVRVEVNSALRARIGELEGARTRDRLLWGLGGGLVGATACQLLCPTPSR